MIILSYISCLVLFFYIIHKLERKNIFLPEIRRKILHIGGGVGALIFPLIFNNRLHVILLSMFVIFILVILRFVPKAQYGITRVLKTEDRGTYGDIYFPLSILILWILAGDDKILYYVPVLILMFSDATAALAGKYYGKFKYDAVEGKKSVEGSIIFFLTTYLFTSMTLQFYTNIESQKIILISLLLGLIEMVLEAISWRGLDNLFIPLMSFFMLKSFISVSYEKLVFDFIITILLFIGSLFGNKKRELASDGTLICFFYAYVLFILGGIDWLIIAVVLFLFYPFVTARAKISDEKPYNASTLIVIIVPTVFWILAHIYFNDRILMFPYLVAFSSHLSIIGISRLRRVNPDLKSNIVISVNTLAGILYMTLFYIILLNEYSIVFWLTSAISILLCTFTFNKLVPIKDKYTLNTHRHAKHTIAVFVFSCIPLVPIYFIRL